MKNLLKHQLESKIKEASQAYYTDGSSKYSDEEFDSLTEELNQIDPGNKLLHTTGHGYDVDKDSTKGLKIKHKYGEAGSLKKCHSYAETPSDIKKARKVVASLKLDGISIVMYYEGGSLVRALTRGNGITGIDVTDKIVKILRTTSIPDKSFTGAVRGEILMSYKNFDLFSSDCEGDSPKNPRNSTAGIINSDGLSPDLSYLDIVVYTVVGQESTNHIHFESYENMNRWLLDNFSKVVQIQHIVMNDGDFISQMNSLRKSWYGIYPADGIVLTDDEIVSLPWTTGEVKYNAVAFKFPAEEKETTVTEVEWNLTKTKYIVPRVKFERIDLSGTSVQYATGFNAKNIFDQHIGVGAKIVVRKSGEIIPQILRVVEPASCLLPTQCPSCNSHLLWSGVHLVCPNVNCGDSKLQDTLVWMKNVSPCDGLGDTLKIQFLEDMMGDDISISKIYAKGKLNQTADRLVKRQLFNDMYNSLFTNQIRLDCAIRAANIPRFGDANSKLIAKYPDVIKEILDCISQGNVYGKDLSQLIGEANSKSLLQYQYKLLPLMHVYSNIIWEPVEDEQVTMSVAITGKLSVPRSQFEAQLKSYGIKLSEISKSTSYLITDDPTGNSSKNKKADSLGITKISESEFRTKFMR